MLRGLSGQTEIHLPNAIWEMQVIQDRARTSSPETAGKPLTVGITGGSASGKTTFARALVEHLEDFSPVLLNQDRYFRDYAEIPEADREAAKSSNHPSAVRWDALTEHIEELVAGRSVVEPAPHTRARLRGVEPATVAPSDLIIVEGHLLFCREQVRKLMELKLFIEADTHERVLRRMLRDTGSSGMDLDRAVAWYRRDVIPNFPVHTAPTRRFADLVIPFDQMNETAIELTALGIRSILNARTSA